VHAQNRDSFLDAGKSIVPYTETTISSKLNCADLVSRTASEFSVLSARLHLDEADAPDHCRISAVIAPEILFELNMPLEWNGRFYMHGNGGFAGGHPSTKADHRNNALRHGFATANTNTGHDSRREPLASFAHNNLQKTIDYAFRAVHLTATYSRQLISEFYAQEAGYSYWDGCSKGGRQGLVSAQRFPEDFDGIVAGAPAFDFSGTMLMYIWHTQVLDGFTFRPEKLKLLTEQVYARCDDLDGLEDGLLTDPRRCDISPSRDLPLCNASVDKDDCFTGQEISLLENIFSGPSRGDKNLYPGVPPGAAVAGPFLGYVDGVERVVSGWEMWLRNSNGPTLQKVMMESYLKYLAFEVDDPEYDWKDFPFETEAEGLDRQTIELLDAKEADLSRFKARGGKMVTYFGWADTAINPLPMIDYYERIENAMDSPPQDFYRLFMVPGMFHCDGGAGADQMDAMTAVIEWVEAGNEPTSIKGNHVVGGSVEFSRPQCPYPQTARYLGSGSTDSAENFECAAPD
jgi:feruloyl esterase